MSDYRLQLMMNTACASMNFTIALKRAEAGENPVLFVALTCVFAALAFLSYQRAGEK